jgi:hypothetical protein
MEIVMSNEAFKFLHSKRMLNTESAIKKQLNIAKSYGVNQEEPHRYAKYHALNCGQKGCIFCSNPRKLFGHKTIQEKSIEQRRLYEEYDFED